MAEITERKKIINPRVEIDTSPPFESVKEAVDWFDSTGPWLRHHLLRNLAHHETDNVYGVEKIGQEAAQLERDLIIKEKQTLNVLKELESAKKVVECLKLNLTPQFSSFVESQNMHIPNQNSTGLMFMDELNQAKSNFNRTSIDLAAIRASVESLNKKMTLENRRVDKKVDVCITAIPKEVNFEAEQFKKMTEASRYEVIKAMTEIERTKNSIKMAEMRLSAAKKMEEAAKELEAIVLLNKRDSKSSDHVFTHKPEGVTLSLQEYRDLSHKALKSEELCMTKFIDTNATYQLEVPIMEKFEEKHTNPPEEVPRQASVFVEDSYSRNNSTKYKFRNSHCGYRNETCGTKEKSTSIGEILSRKLVVENRSNSARQHISLSQMLREQSRMGISPKPTVDENVEKQYIVQRKKFGFIQVKIPTKQRKKKTQPLNVM